MAVFKSEAQLLDHAGSVVGEGHAYIHLRLPEEAAQPVQGTISLAHWAPNAAAPVALELADHRQLPIQVIAESLDACRSGHRILRYRAQWPPRGDAPSA